MNGNYYYQNAYLRVNRTSTRGGAGRRMEYDDYLRDEAKKYKKLAEQAGDDLIKKELFELAAICEEVANNIEDRRSGG